MSPEVLAQRLAMLQQWMGREIAARQAVLHPDRHWPLPRVFADATVVIDPSNDLLYPSVNPNHVEHLGTSGLAGKRILNEIIELYRGAGVSRFFVYVSPSEQAKDLERWLRSAGMEKTVELAVLWRLAGRIEAPMGPFDLRICRSSDVALLRQVFPVGEDLFGSSAGTLDMLEEPGFHTLLATKCDQPVASGSLYAQKDLGYLGNGKTREGFRRQGAQTALIAARVEMAATLECIDVVSETYRFLESSYTNLCRSGFKEVYARSIYRWEA